MCIRIRNYYGNVYQHVFFYAHVTRVYNTPVTFTQCILSIKAHTVYMVQAPFPSGSGNYNHAYSGKYFKKNRVCFLVGNVLPIVGMYEHLHELRVVAILTFLNVCCTSGGYASVLERCTWYCILVRIT